MWHWFQLSLDHSAGRKSQRNPCSLQSRGPELGDYRGRDNDSIKVAVKRCSKPAMNVARVEACEWFELVYGRDQLT